MSSRLFHRWVHRLALVGTGVLTLVVAILALLQLPPAATWVMRRLITIIPLNPGYGLEVGRVSGDWLHHLALDEVRLVRNDRELARVDRVRLGYDLRQLRGAEPRLAQLTAEGARVSMRREGDSWDLANVLRRSADTAGGGGGFTLEHLNLRDAQLAAELAPDSVVRLRGLNLRAHDLVLGTPVLVRVDQLNAALAPPGSARWFAVATRGDITPDEFRFNPVRIQTEQTHVDGRIVLPRSLDDPRLVDRLELAVRAMPLALADLAAVAPGVTPEGSLRLDASAQGNAEGLVVARLGARLDEAMLTLNGAVPLAKGATGYRMNGTLKRLDPSRVYKTAPSGDLNGKVQIDLQGSRLDRAEGTVDLGLAPSRIAGTMVNRLDLHADVHQGAAELRLRGRAEGGTLVLRGRARPFDSIPEYRLTGSAVGIPGSNAVARALTGDSEEPVLDVGFNVAGADLSLTTARLTGRVVLAAISRDGRRVPLGQSTLALAGGRLDAQPELLVAGGRIMAHLVAHLGDTVTYELRGGRFNRVNVGQLLADTTVAPLSGRFSLQGQGVAPTEAVAAARIELGKVRYGSRHVEQVTGLAQLENGRARIEVRGVIQGGSLAIDADARPFDSTSSFHLRRASIERVDLGTFLGRPDLAGPVTLRASGTGRLGTGARTLSGSITVGPSRLGQVELTAGSVRLRLRGERLSYDGSLRTSGGTLDLAGDGRPLGAMPYLAIRRGRADSVDVGALLGRTDLSTDLNARFTGAVRKDSAASLQGKLSLELHPSRINQAQLGGGHVELDLADGTVRGDLRLEGRDGELAARLSGRTGDAMQLHADGNLRLERLARWTGRPDAEGRLESGFVLEAAGDSTGLVSLGGSLNAQGGLGGIRLHAVHLTLVPEPGVIRVDTLFVRSNVGVLDGGGRVALRSTSGSDTLRLTGISADIAPLAALVSADSVSLDSARVALALSGPAGRWRLDGKADAYRVLSAASLAERVTLQAGATLDSTGVSGMAGELRVEGAAYGKVRIPQAQLAGRYDSLMMVQATIELGDSVRLNTALRGVVGTDTLRAVLQRLDLTEGGRAWSLEQPANLELRPRVAVDGFALHAGGRRIIVNGVLDRRSSSDINLRVTNLDLDALRAIRLTPIGGRLDGWLHLSGPAAAPTLEGSVGLGIRQRNGREIGRLRTDLAWNREALRIDATVAPRKGGRLTVNGTLPWRLTLDTTAAGETVPPAADTLGLAVRADSFDLGLFEPLLPQETARDLRGRLVADARVSGKTAAPQADGTVLVTNAALTLPTIGVSYRGGELVGRMAGDQLRIERLRLGTGKEELLTAQGTVRLRPITDPSLDLTAELSKFRISRSSSLQAVASGQLRLQGTATAPSLTGRLTMGRTDIIVGGGQAAATVEKVELTPEDLRQVARQFGPAALARANTGPGLVDRFHLDLNLRLPRRVWFRKRTSPKADIELSGRIRLRQEPGQPMEFFGRVEPIPGRGTLDVYGREFRLTGGEITLAGPTDSTTLDVIAQYQVPTQGGPEDEGVLIEVAAKGHPDSLQLEFSGDPEMSQDDMLSYIVTGRPASDNPLAERAGGGESAGEMGAAVALSGLSQSLSTAAEEELGLDVFQIRQEGLRGLTLTAGRYVGSRVFLSLHMPIELGGDVQQTPGATLGPTFELEYVAQRWLRANVRGGNVAPRFTLRSRYAY